MVFKLFGVYLPYVSVIVKYSITVVANVNTYTIAN